jgi:hydrogenase nickel incorporation protein HypA/HybF
MHEMSLAEGVLQLVEEAAQAQGFKKTVVIWLEIGQLSGVEVEAMRFCFDAVSRDTVAQGARLEIITMLGSGCCQACGQTSPMAELHGECPHCGSYQMKVMAGTEMRVKELEVA